jgi:hypothetical protein
MTASTKAIDFGILPYLANLEHYSYSMWVKRTGSLSSAYLISRSVDFGAGRRGNYFSLNQFGTLTFASYKTPTDGAWWCPGVFTTLSTWQHVAVTYNNTTAKADPVIWLDGVSQAVTETSTPAGTSDDDSDCPLILFNIGPDPAVPGQVYEYDGVQQVAIKDVRIYRRELTPTDIAELVAGEDDYSTVQDGLLFCGPIAPTDNIDDYIGDTIENDDLVLEIVHGAAGIPYNEPGGDMLTGASI